MSLLTRHVFGLNQDVVFPYRVNAAGLGALIAGVFHKIHRCAHLKKVQVFAQQAVAMKVEPPAIHRLNPTIGFVG
jgi:hypothetical protein